MLCFIVSENKKIIPKLISEVKIAGMEYLLFYNSIVALTHLNLYRPDCFVIDSSAFSFISFQSFVDRFQLYDGSLSSLFILTEGAEKIPVPIRKSNILSSPDKLSKALLHRDSAKMARDEQQDSDYSNTTAFSAFFFSGNGKAIDQEITAPEFKILLSRVRICLYSGSQSGVLEVLDDMFFKINSQSDYSLFREICNELNALFLEVRFRIQQSTDSASEIIDFELYQDVFQALTNYKKMFYMLCGKLSEYFRINRPVVADLVQYINEHIDKPLPLAELGQHAHFNTSYLSHLFKQEMGMGVTTFINNLRLHRACDLLESTNLSIAEISEMVGFNDAKYFARLFNKEANISPSAFRRLFRTATANNQRGWVQ